MNEYFGEFAKLLWLFGRFQDTLEPADVPDNLQHKIITQSFRYNNFLLPELYKLNERSDETRTEVCISVRDKLLL